jgi:hypothetical protein
MEPYPLHYSCHQRSEDSSSIDPSVRVMIDEMQRMGARFEGMEVRLMEKIEGCCSTLEQPVVDVEQRSEECFVSLEMSCVEADADRAKLGKQFDGLRLEVHRINWFMERETLENEHRGPGIFSGADHQ